MNENPEHFEILEHISQNKNLAREIFEWKPLSEVVFSLEKMRNAGIASDKNRIKNWRNLVDETLKMVEENFQNEREKHKNPDYWRLRNLSRQAFLFDKAGSEPNIALFSPAGSYGPYYLGKLENFYENNASPDMMIGGSAGALYPTLYELYDMARRENPQETQEKFANILALIPENLSKKDSMPRNGKRLIAEFAWKAQELINVINESRKTKNLPPLSRIEDLRFSELSRPIGVIASRNIGGKNNYQEVLFSGDDNVLNAITASSNPGIHFGPIQFNVVKRVRFSHNFWNDGDHTNPMPTEWIYHFPQGKVTQINAIHGNMTQDQAYDSDFNKVDFGILKDFEVDERKDFFNTILMTDYKWQASGFDKNTAELYTILGNIDVKNFSEIIKKLEYYQKTLSPEDFQKLFRSVIFRLDTFPKGFATLEDIEKFLSFSSDNPLENKKILYILDRIDYRNIAIWNPETSRIIFEKIFTKLTPLWRFSDEKTKQDDFMVSAFYPLLSLWKRIFPDLESFRNFLLSQKPSPDLRDFIENLNEEYFSNSEENEKPKNVKIQNFSDIFSLPVYYEIKPNEAHNILLRMRSENMLSQSVADFENYWKNIENNYEKIRDLLENLNIFMIQISRFSEFSILERQKIQSFLQNFITEIKLEEKLQNFISKHGRENILEMFQELKLHIEKFV